MGVYLGIYNVPTDGGASYERQRGELQSAIQTYGVNNIAGITVGNEWTLKYA